MSVADANEDDEEEACEGGVGQADEVDDTEAEESELLGNDCKNSSRLGLDDAGSQNEPKRDDGGLMDDDELTNGEADVEPPEESDFGTDGGTKCEATCSVKNVHGKKLGADS
jgi:hypothetical protein